MFGWLKSIFGSESDAALIAPPPLPSKVKKAEKLVAKKVSKRAATKKEAPKVEAPKEKVVKEKVTKEKVTKEKAPKKEKKAVTAPVDPVQLASPAPKPKKGGRSKKTASAEPVQKEQNLPNS